jgi:serine/threonine protein kinase
MTSSPPSSGAAQSAWRVQDVIDDLYEVRQVITSGGMGLVHRVFHRQWNVELAVKTPNAAHIKTAQQIRNFEAEAEAWVQLGLHPHVVSCVYVREIDGFPRVFAEWVDGGSLHDAIRSRRLYTGTPDEVLARILDIAIQFAWGLAHAHASGLIHQDVKPANLMLTRDGTAKVSDFGLAKARPAAGSTHTPTPTGGTVQATFAGMTPAYCSPEQAHAPHLIRAGEPTAPLTRATDVWSWAISVWQMFTGSSPVPHGGQLAGEAFAGYRQAPWRDDERIPPIPAPVADVLQRCFDGDPRTRPRDIAALADELINIYGWLFGQPYPRSRPEPAQLLADGLNNHALSMLDLDRPEQAEQLWQQALASDPHHLHAVYNYGLHRWRGGQIIDTDLISQLEAVRATHPGPQPEHLLALVHLERYDTAPARELLTAAFRAAPEDQ